MLMTVTIAPLHPADVPQLVALHRRAFPSFFLSDLGPAFLTEFYRGFLTDPTSVTAVARDDRGDVVGGVVGTTAPAGFFARLLRRRLVGFALAGRHDLPHPAQPCSLHAGQGPERRADFGFHECANTVAIARRLIPVTTSFRRPTV